MSVILADGLVVLHLLFVAFVMAGGFLLLRWPKLVWLHLPAAAWGALIEFTGGYVRSRRLRISCVNLVAVPHTAVVLSSVTCCRSCIQKT